MELPVWKWETDNEQVNERDSLKRQKIKRDGVCRGERGAGGNEMSILLKRGGAGKGPVRSEGQDLRGSE